jgi:hypothetical protein
MSDRDLLEIAAKAAGIETHGAMRADWLNGHSTYWNPLTDDGDALRLAVDLRMNIDICQDGTSAYTSMSVECASNPLDNGAATRRAIVRAAAEIGRSMR